MAQLMNNSTLLKSYEQIIQQYEQDFEKKNVLIRDMERDLQQIQFENSNLAQQLYNLKCNISSPLKGDAEQNDGDMFVTRKYLGRDEKE